MNKRIEIRVQECEIRYLRKIVGKRRIDKIRNDVIRNQIGVEKLGNKIERSQLRWYGHVQRMSDGRLPKQVLNSGTQNMGVRPRGRPRMRWRDKMNEVCVTKYGMDANEIETNAINRDMWKRLTRNPIPQ